MIKASDYKVTGNLTKIDVTTSAYITAQQNSLYFLLSGSNGANITLPSVGNKTQDEIVFVDTNGLLNSTTTVSIIGNINGSTNTLILDVPNSQVSFIWTGSTFLCKFNGSLVQPTYTDTLKLIPSTTSLASLNIPVGVKTTSPNIGDVYSDGIDLIYQKGASNPINLTNKTDWISYTPILTATTTNPVLGTGAVVTARYCVIGKTLKLNVNIYNPSAGTLGSGNYRISIPSEFVIDLTKVRLSTNGYDGSGLGSCLVTIGSSYGANGKVVAVSSTQLGMYCTQPWNTNSPLAFWSSTFHGTGANTCVSFTCEIPIL